MKTVVRQVVRKVLIVLASFGLGAALLVFIFTRMACTEFCKQTEPYETLSIHARLEGKDAATLPFKDFPAPKAMDMIIFDRSLGFTGFEIWTSFRFVNATDFNDYLKMLKSSPVLHVDHTLAWADAGALSGMPATLGRHWDLADVTTGTRVSAQEGWFRQWIFDPARHRVLTVTNDVPAFPPQH